MFRLIATLLGLALACYGQTNLIINGDMSVHTKSVSTPDNWNQGWWGNATPPIFNYPANCGALSTTAASVTLSNWTAGDAKWYSDDVPVTPGATYTFSDVYMSDVMSFVDMRYTLKDGSFVYPRLATLSATNGACLPTKQTTTAPANAVSVSVFHSAASNGTLTTGKYLLVSQSVGGNVFPTGLVTFRYDDIWLSQYNNAAPILKNAGLKGSFYAITYGMLNANEPIYPSSDNPISPVTTKKKTMTTITWSPLYIDPTQTNFNLAVTYSADVSGTFTVDYKMFGGRGAGSISFSVPKGSNMTVSKAFTTPTLGQPMKLSLSVPLGTLTVSSLVLTEAIGYMSTDQVLALQSAGHEIGNHTEHHCDLGVLQNNPTGDLNCALPYTGTITVSSEVGNAQTTLLSSGFTNVNTFAYPYGGGAGDQVVEGIVKNIGLTAASSTTSGYNTPTTNRYNLSVQSVVATTTIADIQGWIDYAAANKLWLILLFHQVENNPTLLAKETYGTTTAILQSAVNYALTKQSTGAIQVMPVRDVITTYYH